MTTRIVVNVKTGQQTVEQLTQQELDDLAARAAADAPRIAALVAAEQEVADVRADGVIGYLATHTPAECVTRMTQLTAEQRWEAVAKALCILARRL